MSSSSSCCASTNIGTTSGSTILLAPSANAAAAAANACRKCQRVRANSGTRQSARCSARSVSHARANASVPSRRAAADRSERDGRDGANRARRRDNARRAPQRPAQTRRRRSLVPACDGRAVIGQTQPTTDESELYRTGDTFVGQQDARDVSMRHVVSRQLQRELCAVRAALAARRAAACRRQWPQRSLRLFHVQDALCLPCSLSSC